MLYNSLSILCSKEINLIASEETIQARIYLRLGVSMVTCTYVDDDNRQKKYDIKITQIDGSNDAADADNDVDDDGDGNCVSIR